ncbi:CoA ester lyase [Amycolatopsis sp.]|uniref:HpcH/HpaI aldolase/citrate lyase family protein n=1 Tax=Amycolatopsis sp. TaxID=37632 RepID=UPI002E0A8615|nr:CoA ester lyase [Amycolatopsis sp.]
MPHRPPRARRSELATPATSEKMLTKAAASDADLVFLDLEDAVAPNAKAEARRGAVAALRGLDWGRKTRAIRVNSVDSQWFLDDMVEVVSAAGASIDVIFVPKVKAARDVWFVDDLLTQLEMKLGLPVGRIGLEVLIEEVEAVVRINEIAASSPRLEALILGVGDLAASQGMPNASLGTAPGYPADVWHFARASLVVAARANGLDAIDGPYGGIDNPQGYTEQARWAAELGAAGKWAIHPSQIAIANDVFAPTADEVAHACRVVEAMRAAEADGTGAVSLDGTFVDAATARMFGTVVRRAELMGLVS